MNIVSFICVLILAAIGLHLSFTNMQLKSEIETASKLLEIQHACIEIQFDLMQTMSLKNKKIREEKDNK